MIAATKPSTSVVFVLGVVVTLATAACRPQIVRDAADKLAQSELTKYAEREGLILSNFSAAEVTEQEKTWLYYYEYGEGKRHLLAVIVHKEDGRTELSRLVEE